MSSWTTMLTASGPTVDAERKIIRFAPKTEPLTIPFVTCETAGTVRASDGKCDVTVTEGTLNGWTVEADGYETSVRAALQG
jgi:hypothetical protein